MMAVKKLNKNEPMSMVRPTSPKLLYQLFKSNVVFTCVKINPILKLNTNKKGLVNGFEINAAEIATTKLNLNTLYSSTDKIVLNPNVGNTPQNAPMAAPNAISCALPLA